RRRACADTVLKFVWRGLLVGESPPVQGTGASGSPGEYLVISQGESVRGAGVCRVDSRNVDKKEPRASDNSVLFSAWSRERRASLCRPLRVHEARRKRTL